MYYGVNLLGQDVFFSGINGSLLLLNPSISNFSNYSQEFGINYRRSLQLTDSNSASQQYSVYWRGRTIINRHDKIGFQARILQDKPQGGPAAVTDVIISANYEKRLIDNGLSYHSLAIGFSTGINFRNIGNDQFWFGSQYDIENERIDYTRPNGEILLDQLVSRVALDLNVGISWRSHFDNGSELQLGGSIFHLLPYNQSLMQGGINEIEQKITLMVNGKLPLSPFIDYSPTIIGSFQGLFKTIVFRNIFVFDANSREGLSFGFGIGPKWIEGIEGFQLESLSLMTVIDLPRGMIELSYDISTGLISQYNNGRGNIELGLSYYIMPNEKDSYKRRIY